MGPEGATTQRIADRSRIPKTLHPAILRSGCREAAAAGGATPPAARVLGEREKGLDIVARPPRPTADFVGSEPDSATRMAGNTSRRASWRRRRRGA